MLLINTVFFYVICLSCSRHDFICPALAQRSPSISYITQDQYCEIGSSVKLECSVQFSYDYNVQWIKDRDEEVSFLTIGQRIIVDDSRFLISYNPYHSIYALTINDLQETDSGEYKCRVVLSVTEFIEAAVEVYILRPPVILDNSTQSLIAAEGDSVEMECSAIGYPSPTIMWRNSVNSLLPTGAAVYEGNTLRFESVRKEDRGTYYCVADNGVGQADTRNVNLEVEFAPIITVDRPNVGQALLNPADLICHIEAFPAPAIWWERDDVAEMLSTNRYYSISQFITDDEVTDTTLRIIKTEKRQFGGYYCKAGNRYGRSQARVQLYETVIPVCPPACT